MANKKVEENIQQSFCNWLKLQHPNVIFKSDLSGIKLTKGQAAKVSKGRSSAGFCDLDILEPNLEWKGLFFEFKTSSPFKPNGELYKMVRYRKYNGLKVPYDHLQEQQDMISKLIKKGYFACFVWSLGMAIAIFEAYIKNDVIPLTDPNCILDNPPFN